MKKLVFALALLFVSFLGANAQKYVVDIVFTPDSTVAVCRPVVPENSKSKSGKKDSPKYDKAYLHNGDVVQVVSEPLDSMGFVKFMAYRDVHIKFNGKDYTTKARNLVLSEDNPEGTVDTIYENLDTRPALWDIDMHGKSGYLFNVRLLVILLIIGLAGAFLTMRFGLFGLPFFVAPMLYFCWYLLNLGTQSYWFMDDMAWGDRFYYYLFFALIEAYVFFGGKAVLQFYGEGFIIGLIFTLLFLPVLYIAVWGAIATQWLVFVIIAGAYLWVTGTRDFGSGGSGGIFGALESNQKTMDANAKRVEKFNREQNFFNN